MTEARHGTAAVNGVELHYAEIGAGDLVLFLHGFPEFWYAWRHQLADLGRDHHAVAVDTRGINLSSKPADPSAYHLDQLVEDARQLIGHLGHGRATVVGHDWGGFIAWWLAIRHPEAVAGLVAINAAHPGIFSRLLRDSPAQREASRYMEAFRSARGEELLSREDFGAFRANILEPGRKAGHLRPEDEAAYLQAWRRPGALTAGLNYYRANQKIGATLAADTRVAVPTLVIWGDKDPYFSLENLDSLPDCVADLRVRRYPENDHWIVHQIPGEVNRLIRDFMAARL